VLSKRSLIQSLKFTDFFEGIRRLIKNDLIIFYLIRIHDPAIWTSISK